MIVTTQHEPNTIDVMELATFTNLVYDHVHIPHRHGDSVAEIATFLEKNCPDYFVVAREGKVLHGWAGLYYQSSLQLNLIGWHPLVFPENPALSQRIVRECILHAGHSGRIRMDVLLLTLTSEYRDAAAVYGGNYEAAGMVRGAEWLSMEADLSQLAFPPQETPQGLSLRPFSKVSCDGLWTCFDTVFMNGADQSYAQQPLSQRRDSFDTYFCRREAMDDGASLVLIEDTSLVGFVKVDVVDGKAYGSGIGILPTYRRRGLARYLLGTSMRRVAEHQNVSMVLQVECSNLPGLRLYQGLGFRSIDHGWVSYYWQDKDGTYGNT